MKTILIVEDDQKIARALVIRLKAQGYQAFVAPDSVTGAAQGRTLKPDLILLDITLPGGNGFQLAETFHRMPETRDTPIICVTASRNPELLQKITDLGVIGLFEKPFDTEKLLGSIDRLFDKQTDLINARQRSLSHQPVDP
jgi:DNA-binding response OmpR family regulator